MKWTTIANVPPNISCFTTYLQQQKVKLKNRPGTSYERSQNGRLETLASLIKGHGSSMDLADGKRIHVFIVQIGFQGDRFLGNLLMEMYGRCGDLQDALAMFSSIHQPNVFTWNIMIGAYVQNGQDVEALRLFQQMQLEDLNQDKVTFLAILSACTSQKNLDEGKRVELHIVTRGLDADVVAVSALVSMYSKCGSLEDAQRLFEKLPERDIVTWNTMIAAYAQHGEGNKAFQLFQRMLLNGVAPSGVTYSTMFAVCATNRSLAQGRHLHACVRHCSFELDVMMGNILVSMYGKCGSLQNARQTFDSMPERDVVTWSTIIAVYAHHNQGKEALQTFEQMQLEGVIPDKVTLMNCLSACTFWADLAQGKRIHICILMSGFTADVVVETALINVYSKCLSLEDAQNIFDGMFQRDVVAYNVMIAAHSQCGQRRRAAQLFEQMLLEGIVPEKGSLISLLDACGGEVPLKKGKCIHACILYSGIDWDINVETSLVNMYGKCGNLNEARLIFDIMYERDVVAWNAMISATALQRQCDEVLRLFQQMQLEGSFPDKATYVSCLSVCVSEAVLDEGKRMHTGILCSLFESDIVVGTALVNMYGKCGSLENALMIFDKMTHRNVVSWNAVLAAYAQHGQCREALQLFQEMEIQGVPADDVTFYSILSACSHAGFVDEGCHYFVSMSQEHGIAPTVEHYNCLIDLLGRAGRLEEGENLIKMMTLKPVITSWMTLLGACRTHSDVERGRQVAYNILKVEPESDSPITLLANILVSVGRWDDAVEVRTQKCVWRRS